MSHRTLRAAVVATLALLMALALAPAAHASDLECRGPLGAVTVAGNLLVPDDSTCTLDGTTVLGSIVVKSRATLVATGIGTDGSIQGESPARVDVSDSWLGNSVQLRKGGPVDLAGNAITGDIALEENLGAVDLTGNEVVGSVQANKNTGGLVIFDLPGNPIIGRLVTTGNVIGNGLHCQDNVPPPTGGGNTAKQKQGQCLNL